MVRSSFVAAARLFAFFKHRAYDFYSHYKSLVARLSWLQKASKIFVPNAAWLRADILVGPYQSWLKAGPKIRPQYVTSVCHVQATGLA